MTTSFESPIFLSSQTRENLKEFDSICKSVFYEKCYSHVIDIDQKSGNKTFKIKFNHPVPAKARHIAATAISDLRHALDQAACASVNLITGKDPGLIYFPFATNPNDLMGRLRKNFPDEIHPILASFQPYPTGDSYEGGNRLLSLLGMAAGPNKHQMTCKIGGQIIEFRGDSIRADGMAISINLPPLWDIDKNEMIVGVMAATGHLYYNFGFTFYIALAHAGPLSGAPAADVLGALVDQVDNIVSALQTETARLLRERQS